MKIKSCWWVGTCAVAMTAHAGAALVGLWSFDGDAKDTSGNALNGEVTGAVFSTDVPSQLAGGKSLQFEGGDQVVEIPHNTKLDITEAMTISAWVKPVGDAAWDGILAKNPSDESSPNHAGNYELRIENGSRVLTFLYQRGNTDDTASVASTGKVVADVWQHLAVTAVKAGEAVFYLNGVEIGRRPVPETFGVPNTNPLFIGSRNDRFIGMDGFIDEVALYNEALSADAIRVLASGPAKNNTPGDADADGIPDAIEKLYAFLNPAVAADAAKDQDGDGLSNLDEYKKGTALEKADTDGDGLSDKVESKSGTFVSASDSGTDPKLADTDGDGLSDGDEITGKNAKQYTSNPLKPDTDEDGISDGREVALGSNPADAKSVPGKSIVGLWTFDATGATQPDKSGSGHTATVQGGVKWVNDTERKSGVMEFTDADQYLEVADTEKLSITGDITIAAWVNATDYSGYRSIVGKTVNNLPSPYDLYLLINTGEARFYLGNGQGTHNQSTGSTAPTEAKWQHVAVTKSGIDIVHYLDGEENGTGSVETTIEDGDGTLLIGNRADLFTQFAGRMDDVVIFDGAVSPAEIKTIMSGNFSSFLSGGGTVPETPRIRITTFDRLVVGNEVSLRVAWTSEAGKGYAIEFSRDLKTWQVLQESPGAAGATTLATVKLPDGNGGFARVRLK